MSSLSLTLPLVSPLVTRVLELRDFSPQLQTRDIHTLLSGPTNGDESAYKIKWRNDTSAYIIFQDPSVAKLAYIQLLCSPPPLMQRNLDEQPSSPLARLIDVPYATVRPRTGSEAASLLNAMPHASGTRNMSSGSHARLSWGPGEHNMASSLPPRHFSNEAVGAQRRIRSNALPNKPSNHQESNGASSRPYLHMEPPSHLSSHSHLPASGVPGVDSNDMPV